MNDVIIIGSGPAGYTASIYCARANLNPILYEGTTLPGGQLTTTTDIENFPGFPDGINGFDLMENMKSQAIKFGTQIISENVDYIDLKNYPFTVNDKKTKSVIIATGATAKKLDVNGVSTFWNHGISACAVCDGALPMFRRKILVVIGGGDSAVEEATFLSKYASKVYLLVRSNKLRASKIMTQKLLSNDKIGIYFNTELVECLGTKNLESIVVKNNLSNIPITINCSGLFFAIGHTPNTSFLNGQVELDEDGYIKTNNTKTSIKGVFACGDVQDKIYRQAITAAGSGCMSALECEKFLETLN